MGAHISSRVRVVHEPKGCPPARELGMASAPLGPSSHGLAVLHFEDERAGCGSERADSLLQRGDGPRQYRDAAVLSEIIKQRIRVRTSERIRDLDVLCQDGRIIIRGRCATFYTKQLAQHAAMGVVEDETLVNEVAVGLP